MTKAKYENTKSLENQDALTQVLRETYFGAKRRNSKRIGLLAQWIKHSRRHGRYNENYGNQWEQKNRVLFH